MNTSYSASKIQELINEFLQASSENFMTVEDRIHQTALAQLPVHAN